MKKIIILLSFIFLPISVLDASEMDTISNEAIFQKANEAYQQENYEAAFALYQQIASAGYEGATLFYNMGNAGYKQGEKALALVWYERALRLDPANEDIKHNIAFVNQTLTDRINILPEFMLTKVWNSISKSCTSNIWSVISCVFCFLFFIFLGLFIFSRRSGLRYFSFVFSVLLLFLLIFSFLFAYQEKIRYEKKPEAIVMQSVVTAKSTPINSGADLFVIHEGLKVSITDRVADWVEVKLPNGEKGWLPNKVVEEI